MRIRRRFGLSVIVILVLCVAGYSAWWYVLARRVESGFAAWAAARRAEGWTVSVGASRLGGWPRQARLVLSDVKLRGGAPELPVAFAWDAARLDLQVSLFHPSSLVVLPRGRQIIGLPDGPRLAVTGRVLQGRLPLDRAGPPWPLAIRAERVRVRSLAAGASSRSEAQIGSLTAHAALDSAASASATALALTVDAAHIALPSGSSWPLGERIETAAGDIALSGPVPAGAPAVRAKAWQQAGGAIVLRQGTLHWGPLEAVATGRLSLDAALQPAGEGVAHITGWAPALDVLAAHHVIPDHAALAAKAVVSLLAETPQGGGASVFTVPFAAKDGVLSLRGIPVARLPALPWPGS